MNNRGIGNEMVHNFPYPLNLVSQRWGNETGCRAGGGFMASVFQGFALGEELEGGAFQVLSGLTGFALGMML